MRHPRTIVTTAALLTGAALWAAPRVAFDYDFMNLQAAGTESVVWERKSAAAAGRSGSRRLATARSLEELEVKAAAFQRLPSVSDVQSVSSVMPDRQAEKLAVLRTPRCRRRQHPRRRAVPPVDLDALIAALETLEASDWISRPREAVATGLPRRSSSSRARRRPCFRGSRCSIGAPSRFGSAISRSDSPADFAEQWQRLQRATRPAPVTPRRSARRASAEVHRQERPPASADLLPARPSGNARAAAHSRRNCAPRPGRHRAADRRLRIDAADREGVFGRGWRTRSPSSPGSRP